MGKGTTHCMKSVCVRSFSGPYFPALRLITNPNFTKTVHLLVPCIHKKGQAFVQNLPAFAARFLCVFDNFVDTRNYRIKV